MSAAERAAELQAELAIERARTADTVQRRFVEPLGYSGEKATGIAQYIVRLANDINKPETAATAFQTLSALVHRAIEAPPLPSTPMSSEPTAADVRQIGRYLHRVCGIERSHTEAVARLVWRQLRERGAVGPEQRRVFEATCQNGADVWLLARTRRD